VHKNLVLLANAQARNMLPARPYRWPCGAKPWEWEECALPRSSSGRSGRLIPAFGYGAARVASSQ